MRPVIAIEINEIPWRLIDRYEGVADYPHIRTFFDQCHEYTSLAVDSGELSPWVTWPSMHRGMSNDEHGVFNLGQDPATFRGTPLWEEFRRQGMAIGLCGAMQSWPPADPGPGGFYVPDTFARDAACFPSYVEPLQAVNLSQVKKNPRVVSSDLPSAKEIRLLLSCMRHAGIRLRTLARITAQLVHERFDKTTVARRPIFQTLLFWDVFRKHFNPYAPPAYSSFFTNHVAGVMHRYWRDIFPEDFPEREVNAKFSREPLMRFALSVLDEMLADVLQWTQQNPNIAVVFASSMGQGPIHRDYHEGIELHITDVDALLKTAGLLKADYKLLLAMVPQVAADIPSEEKRAQAIAWLSGCVSANNAPLFHVKEIGVSLSISSTLPSRTEIEAGYAVVNQQRMPFTSLGLTAREIEAGSGYHIPEGSFAVWLSENGANVDKSRKSFPASRYKSWLSKLVEHGVHDPQVLLAGQVSGHP